MGIDVTFSDVAKLDSSAKFCTDHMIARVSTDTRLLQVGDAYLALIGERFDGHDFVQQAIDAGAACVIVSREVDVGVPVLSVADTTKTLGYIARIYRDQLSATVIGITGSNGKTTVKGMLQSVSESFGNTTATVANNNNTIGVPLTLLSASRDDKTVVVEMGTSEQGEIPRLVRIVNPDVVVITNVSESHLDGLGSKDDVFTEKSAIITGAHSNGVVVVNLDDAYSEKSIKLAGERRVFTYGVSKNADVSLENMQQFDVELSTPQGVIKYQLQVPGLHNVSNSMAVVALALAANIDVGSIISGLESYRGTKGRLQIKNLPGDITLLDDTYNANPASSHAALDVLASYPGRKLFAYAGMAELGGQAKELHRDVGVKAEDVGIHRLYVFGPDARPTYEAFSGEKFYFDQVDDLSSNLVKDLLHGDTVLLKGSRRFRMERVGEYLLERVN